MNQVSWDEPGWRWETGTHCLCRKRQISLRQFTEICVLNRFRGWWIHIAGSQHRMFLLQVFTLGDEKYQTVRGQQLHLNSQAWYPSSRIFKEKVRQTSVQASLGMVNSSSEQENEHTSWLTFISLIYHVALYRTDKNTSRTLYQSNPSNSPPGFLCSPAWLIYYILYPERVLVKWRNSLLINNIHNFYTQVPFTQPH